MEDPSGCNASSGVEFCRIGPCGPHAGARADRADPLAPDPSLAHREPDQPAATSPSRAAARSPRSADENLRVTLIADDPQGIRRIELGGGPSPAAASPAPVRGERRSTRCSSQVARRPIQQHGPPSIFLQKDIPVPYECPAGRRVRERAGEPHGMATLQRHGEEGLLDPGRATGHRRGPRTSSFPPDPANVSARSGAAR